MSEVHKFYIKGHEVLIDKDKVELVYGRKWHLSRHINESPYLASNYKIQNKWYKILLHRLLLNAEKEQIVDHINGNTLDNRISNLRFCTSADNAKNRRSYKGLSKYKGVILKTYKNTRYIAQIRSDKHNIHIGSFSSEIEAAKAYNQAAIKYHGEFANLNKFE